MRLRALARSIPGALYTAQERFRTRLIGTRSGLDHPPSQTSLQPVAGAPHSGRGGRLVRQPLAQHDDIVIVAEPVLEALECRDVGIERSAGASDQFTRGCNTSRGRNAPPGCPRCPCGEP
jgi:hypothetical protein